MSTILAFSLSSLHIPGIAVSLFFLSPDPRCGVLSYDNSRGATVINAGAVVGPFITALVMASEYRWPTPVSFTDEQII